jgi:hypothetical protein
MHIEENPGPILPSSKNPGPNLWNGGNIQKGSVCLPVGCVHQLSQYNTIMG